MNDNVLLMPRLTWNISVRREAAPKMSKWGVPQSLDYVVRHPQAITSKWQGRAFVHVAPHGEKGYVWCAIEGDAIYCEESDFVLDTRRVIAYGFEASRKMAFVKGEQAVGAYLHSFSIWTLVEPRVVTLGKIEALQQAVAA